MMKELKDLIKLSQNHDEAATIELIKAFQPKINKYTRLMHYDEDFKSDLTLFLIETIHNLKLDKFRILNDYSIIKYISKTLYHHYIYLSNKTKRTKNTEQSCETTGLENWGEVDYDAQKTIDDLELELIVKPILTEREYLCVKLMVFEGLSSTEASHILRISRQSANQGKLRALSKLRRSLLEPSFELNRHINAKVAKD